MTPTLHVAMLAFDGMEVLDFTSPFEVFTTASRVRDQTKPGEHAPLFSVCCVARNMQPVRTRADLRIVPDADFSVTRQTDVLVIPGGVVDHIMECSETTAWIREVHATSLLTASVCTGAFLLAAAGVVTVERVTTHWEDVEELRRRFPALNVVENIRWVDSGRVLSSAGISAGIDMSLHIVAKIGGTLLAHKTARQMDYAWNALPH